MSDIESDQDEEYVNTFDEQYMGLKNIVIIVIDINDYMFDAKKRLIKIALAAVYEQINKIILHGYKRNISVCFLRDSDIILTAFNDNIVDSAKKIFDLLKKSTEELKDMFERTTVSLHFTLTECMKQFKNLNKTIPHIVLITPDDDPHKGDVNENLSAIDVALSLNEANVKLIVLPLKKDFNYELFYGELLKTANDVPLDLNADTTVYDSVESITDILSSIIQSKVTIQRHYFRLYSKEGQELGFWTQYRSLSKSNNLYTNCSISRETKNPVKQQFEDNNIIDHNKLLVKIPLEKDIVLDKNEIKETYQKMAIGFQLLYLTNNKQTSIHYLHKKGIVLQNDETLDNKNDKKSNLFNDLWHYCHMHKKYMVCAVMFAGNRQSPKLIEFTPDCFQSKPCFVGQFFVDCEEVADYPSDDENCDEKKSKIPENDRELNYMCTLVDKLKIPDFSPNLFQCYEYEAKSSLIKSQLLDIDVQEVEDSFPTNEQIDDKIGELKNQLKDIFAVVAEPKPKRSRNK